MDEQERDTTDQGAPQGNGAAQTGDDLQPEAAAQDSQPESQAAADQPEDAQPDKKPAKASKKKTAKKSKAVIGFRVLKPLAFNGLQFQRDDAFLPSEIGCSPLRLRQLQDCRRVSNEIVTGKAPNMKGFRPASKDSRAALIHSKGQKAADRALKRIRLE